MTNSTAKTCSVCGEDVSRVKRTKDQLGNYYCGPCLEKRKANAVMGSPERRQKSPDSVSSTAHKSTSFAGPKLDREQRVPWYRSKGIVAATLIIGAAIACAVLYFGVIRDRWENTNRGTISAMKAEADSLSRQGKLEQAELKYDEALKLVAGHQIRDSTLRSQIADMQTSFNQLPQMIADRQAQKEEADRLADLERKAAAKRKADADRALADQAEAERSLKLAQAQAQEAARAAQVEFDRELADVQTTLTSGQLEQAFTKCKALYARRPTDEACLALLSKVSRAIYCSLQYQEDQPLTGHTRGVLFVALTEDGTHAASYGLDHTVRLWNLGAKDPQPVWTIQEADVTGLAFTPDGKSLLLNKGIQQFCRINLSNGEEELHFQHPTARESGEEQPLAFTPDGKFLISGGIDEPHQWTDEDGISQSYTYPVCVYEAGSGKLAATYFGHTTYVSCLAESDDGTLMASGQGLGASPSIILWDKQKLLPRLKIRNSAQKTDVSFHNIVSCVAFGRDGTHLYASGDISIRVFEVGSGALKRKIDVPNASGVPEILVCQDDQRVIARLQPRGRDPGALQVWDTNTGAPLQTLHAKVGSLSPLDGTNSMAQSADGHLLICAGKSGLIHVFTATANTLWEKEAVAYFEMKVLHLDDGKRGRTADAAELAWLQSAQSGQGEAADRQRVSEHNAQQQALLVKGQNEAAARRLARESAPGSPKGEADALITAEISKGTIISAEFTAYGWDRGLRTAQALSEVPKDVDQIHVYYQFTYVTNGGLQRTTDGAVILKKTRTIQDINSGDPSRGTWVPTIVSIGDGVDRPVE